MFDLRLRVTISVTPSACDVAQQYATPETSLCSIEYAYATTPGCRWLLNAMSIRLWQKTSHLARCDFHEPSSVMTSSPW